MQNPSSFCQPDTLTDEQQLWQQAAAILRTRLPRADYDTWLRDLEPVALDPPHLILRTANHYGRDWILAKYAGEIRTVLASLNSACQNFSLLLPEEELAAPAAETALPPESSAGAEDPAARAAGAIAGPEPGHLTLAPRYLSAYDEIVRPERIIAFPSYYLRWIPYLGVDLAWLPIGFRQVAFLRGMEYRAGSSFQASGREIARWSGMGMRTFWRRVKDPLLRWFIRPLEEEMVTYSLGADGRPHREPSQWEVVLSMPLTPRDQHTLRRWLSNQQAQGFSAVHILDRALQLEPELLLPPMDAGLPPEIGGQPVSVQQVIQDTLGPHPDPAVQRSVDSLADTLAAHILGSPHLVSHYFIQQWLPILGAGPGWLVTLLRAISPNPGAAECEVEIPDGYQTLASRLGLSDSWRIGRWLRGQGQGASHLPRFLEETGSSKQSNQLVSRRFWISRMDPPTDADLASRESAGQGPRASGTHRQPAVRVSGSISPPPSRVAGTDRKAGDRDSGSLEFMQGARVSGTHNRTADRDSGTRDGQGVRVSGTAPSPAVRVADTGSSGGLIHTESQQLNLFKTTTAVNSANCADSESDWSWDSLLSRARIASSRAAQLQQQPPHLFVSWLLYAASDRGRSLRDPVGHAVSRMLEEPTQGAGRAFEILARLGPESLGELIQRELSSGDAGWGNADWKQAMVDASRDRLKALADFLGLAWRDADVPHW